jgi:hypothetical protein
MVKIKDLSDQILDKTRTKEVLFCENCMVEYSANKADYFMSSDETDLICECGQPFILVEFNREMEVIKC